MCKEKTAETALRVEPNSSRIGRRKMENDWRGPMEIPQTVKIVTAMIHP
jgi:hypothetical protein